MHTIAWALAASVLIVIIAAGLGRAAFNLQAAVVDKPDIAIYLLLPDEGITHSLLLRERETERDYLVETTNGQKLVKLKKGEEQWYVADVQQLRE